MATFVLTEAEYVEACQLFARLTRRKAMKLAAFTAVVAAAAVWTFDFDWPGVGAGVIGGIVGGGLVAFIAKRYILPYRARALYRQHLALREPFSLSWDANGISCSTPSNHGTTPWSHYREVREGAKTFILFVTDNMYHIVPKSALGDEGEVAAFRGAAARVRI